MFINSVNIANIGAIGLPSWKGSAVDELIQAQLTKSSRGMMNWVFFVHLSDSVLFFLRDSVRDTQSVTVTECQSVSVSQSQIGLGL